VLESRLQVWEQVTALFCAPAQETSEASGLVIFGEPTDLAALRSAMRIIDGPGGHCMCFGGPTLEILSVNRSRLALLGIHHGLAIGCEGLLGALNQ
jgi:hypothetical protein